MRSIRSLLTLATAMTAFVSVNAPATAATSPLSRPSITAHFDLSAGQTPENIAVRRNGSSIVTFVGSRQVAHVKPNGAVRILATLPKPADGGIKTPLGGAAAPTGVARAKDGTIFVAYAAGDSRLTGLWSFKPGGTPHRIAALPATSFPNGIALDETSDQIYIADSTLGTVWKVSRDGGDARAWSTSRAFEPTAFAGANGLKVHSNAVWVTNTDAGTLLRVPIKRHGTAGAVQVRASGLTSVDDFAFTGRGNEVLAALFFPSEVVLVNGNGPRKTVLTSDDGLQNPTAVSVQRSSVVVSSSARATGVDPNLLKARFAKGSRN